MRSTLQWKLAPASVSISSLLLARLDSQAGRNHLNLRSTLRFDKSSRDCVYRQPLRLLSWCLFQRRPSRRRELPLQCMVYRAGQVSHCPTCRRHLFQLSPQGCGSVRTQHELCDAATSIRLVSAARRRQCSAIQAFRVS